VIVGAALFGIVLRAFVLTSALRVADSDESVTGLMARHLLHHPGGFPVFAWATNYAGNFETAVIAVPFALFGSSVLAMKLTVASLHVVACLLLWRVGRRLIDERAGVVAALALWIWPGVYVWWSTKARDYEALLVFGLAALLCGLRLADNYRSRRDWFTLGLVAGVGWWTNPQVAYLVIPAGLWVVIADRRALRYAPLAIPTFVLGALPWIVWNLRHDWGSLHSQFGATESYLAHLGRFWREGIPMALGLRVPYTLGWIVPGGAVIAALVVVAGAGSLLTRRRGALFLAVALVAYPLIHAFMPVAGYTGEGRYLYLLAPLLALLVAHAARNRVLVAVVFVLMAAVTVGQLSTMGDGDSGMASNLPPPAEMGPLVRTLRAERIDAVYADYWIAYRLTFVSRETVIAMGVPTNRYAPYEAHVRRSPRSAWVYVAGSIAEQHFTAALDTMRLPYRTLRPGKWAVHIPDRPVRPEEVPLS
jgi:4-amino-4-deoxy-L-arabinose transferase-like glycosyltransferase